MEDSKLATMDKIKLTGMVFYGYHGVSLQERELGQRFVIDLEVEKDVQQAGLSDDPSDTVNYSQMYELVKDILEGPSRNLLENVAETVAAQILANFDVDSVNVRVKKPEVPMRGSILDYASVEVIRYRT